MAAERLRYGKRTAGSLVALGVALGVAVGCVGPARTEGAYRGKAATTLDQVRSAVETAQAGTGAAGDHDLPNGYVSVLLAEAEEDASAAEDTFSSVQPPSERSDGIRTLTREAIGEAVDVLAELRIEARRGGDLRRLSVHLPDLRRLSLELDELATELRRG